MSAVVVLVLSGYYGLLKTQLDSGYRLRWFWLSIGSIYLFNAYSYYDDVYFDGYFMDMALLPALLKIAILWILMAAARLLWHGSTPEDILYALLWLLGHWSWSWRVALRISLTFDQLPQLQRQLQQQRAQLQQAGMGSWNGRAISQVLARLLAAIPAAAAQAPNIQLIDNHRITAPPKWQWGYLVILSALLWV